MRSDARTYCGDSEETPCSSWTSPTCPGPRRPPRGWCRCWGCDWAASRRRCSTVSAACTESACPSTWTGLPVPFAPADSREYSRTGSTVWAWRWWRRGSVTDDAPVSPTCSPFYWRATSPPDPPPPRRYRCRCPRRDRRWPKTARRPAISPLVQSSRCWCRICGASDDAFVWIASDTARIRTVSRLCGSADEPSAGSSRWTWPSTARTRTAARRCARANGGAGWPLGRIDGHSGYSGRVSRPCVAACGFLGDGPAWIYNNNIDISFLALNSRHHRISVFNSIFNDSRYFVFPSYHTNDTNEITQRIVSQVRTEVDKILAQGMLKVFDLWSTE